MKVNLDKSFVDCFGREIANDTTKKGSNIAESLCMVLFNLNTLGGAALPADKKYQLHRLCRKIAATPGAVEMSTEEASLLKEVAAEAYSCGAYGQVADLIEQND